MDLIVGLLGIGLFLVAAFVLGCLRQGSSYPTIWIPLFVDLSLWIYFGFELSKKLGGIGGGPGWGGDAIRPIMLLLFFSPAVPLLLAVLCVPPPVFAWTIKSLAGSLFLATIGAIILWLFALGIGQSLHLT